MKTRCDLVLVLLRQVHGDDALGHAHLNGGEPDAGGLVHGLEHVLDQLLHLRVDLLDRFGDEPQPLVGDDEDVAQRHARDVSGWPKSVNCGRARPSRRRVPANILKYRSLSVHSSRRAQWRGMARLMRPCYCPIGGVVDGSLRCLNSFFEPIGCLVEDAFVEWTSHEFKTDRKAPLVNPPGIDKAGKPVNVAMRRLLPVAREAGEGAHDRKKDRERHRGVAAAMTFNKAVRSFSRVCNCLRKTGSRAVLPMSARSAF